MKLSEVIEYLVKESVKLDSTGVEPKGVKIVAGFGPNDKNPRMPDSQRSINGFPKNGGGTVSLTLEVLLNYVKLRTGYGYNVVGNEVVITAPKKRNDPFAPPAGTPRPGGSDPFGSGPAKPSTAPKPDPFAAPGGAKPAQPQAKSGRELLVDVKTLKSTFKPTQPKEPTARLLKLEMVDAAGKASEATILEKLQVSQLCIVIFI